MNTLSTTSAMSTSLTPSFSLKQLMSKARGIENSLFEQDDVKAARKAGRELYELGNKMIENGVSSHPLADDANESVLPVIEKLCAIMARPGYQDCVSLNRTLAKAYRVFLELRINQSCRRKERMSVFPIVRDTYIQLSKDMSSILRSRKNSTLARFELRCARQAARCLATTDSKKIKYVFLAVDLCLTLPGLIKGDPVSTWEALKKIARKVAKDDLTALLGFKSWYPYVRYLRWEAKRVSTLEQFEKTIEPMWEIAQNEGGNYSNALAVVLMEIIKNGTDQVVKQRACMGDGYYKLGLTHLITIEKVGKWKNSARHLTDYFPEKFNQKDRFWETRQIVTQYLFRLATKPKYKDFRECSRTALINRLTDLGNGNKEKRSKEREKLGKLLLANQDLRDELEPKMGKLYGEVKEAKRGTSIKED
ncbi:MAG: hypothetical protein ACXWM2_02115, partial [Parachlamydiaceae bacterium]